MSATTSYDVLGVTADASQTKLKQAYIKLAQVHHPDRQSESSPAARQQAEQRMREINAAWEDVSTPGRRAAYDRSLRGDPAWETRTASGGTRAPRTAPVRPGDGGAGPQMAGHLDADDHVSIFWRFGPVVLLGVVLITILIFTAYANAPSDGVPTDPAPRQLTPFRVGNCVVFASTGGRVTPIDAECGTTGAFEIRAITDLGRPCAQGLEPFDITDEETRLCVAV